MRLRWSQESAAANRELAVADDPDLFRKDAFSMTVAITSHSSVELYDPQPVQWMIRLWTCPSSACISTAPQLPQM